MQLAIQDVFGIYKARLLLNHQLPPSSFQPTERPKWIVAAPQKKKNPVVGDVVERGSKISSLSPQRNRLGDHCALLETVISHSHAQEAIIELPHGLCLSHTCTKGHARLAWGAKCNGLIFLLTPPT